MTNDDDQAEGGGVPTRDQVRAGVLAGMTGPGGPFELTKEPVRGWTSQVFVNRHRSLRELAADAAKFADAEFLVMPDRNIRLTYAEFSDRVRSVAAGLAHNHGIGHGDRVAIFAANSPEWVVTFWAATSLGAIAVAMNGWWTADECSHAFASSEPKIVIGDSRRLERLSDLATPPEAEIVDIDSDTFAALWSHDGSTMPVNDIDEDDPALILFTSGTTGRAKGATISHRGVVGFPQSMILGAALRAVTESAMRGEAPSAGGDTQITLGGGPLFHVSGLFGHMLMNLTIGGKVVYFSGRFDAEKILPLIESEGINAFSPIGATGARLINHPRFSEYDTSSIQSIGLGGAPTSPAMQQALRDAFPNANTTIGGGYGSSESTVVVTSMGDAEFEAGPERAGTPHPDLELEIRNDAGQALPTGEEGAIWVRSAYVMLGYWNDPASTAETLTEDGWLNMGDIGSLDEDGYLTINSRARDMILRSAENIYPIEIENRLQAHENVAEVAVIGVDHPEHGQEVKAVVVVSDPAAPDLTTQLHAWCAETLAAHKVPSVWELRTDPLPRNASGKLLKRELG